ncbi:MAG: diguanylate cyclase [Halarcobacter sp.]
MKKLIYIIILLILPIYLSAIEDKVYKVAITKDWKPYYFINDKGKPDGYGVELFENIAKNLNIKYKYIVVDNFKDLIDLFKNNEADIIPNIGISQKRENIFLFSQPTDTFLIKIYKRKETKNINTKYDLINKKVGVGKENICNKIIDKSITKKKVVYENYKNLIKALNDKKIDAFCYPETLIQKANYKNIIPLDSALKEIKRGFGIVKHEFDLLPRINDEITNIKLNGKFEKIHSKWFKNKKYIELTKNETIFLVVSFFGVIFTSFVLMLYFINKKKWLITKDMLIDEVNKRTRALQIQNQRLKKIHRKLKEQTNKDALTKIYNRKFYNQKIKEMISLYKRYNQTFSFLIFDIDNFKKVNDTYGHDKGDLVLKEATKTVNEAIRTNDYFFRIGGEEFVVLLSETNLSDSKEAAEKIRVLISEKVNCIENEIITISIGLTEINKDDDCLSIFKRADRLLYEAKRDGKNQVKS